MPFVPKVGIAWFDERPPPMEEITLRTGGLPLMTADTGWPVCPVCARAMVFRAQLPLAVSGLVGVDDERVLLIFECHERSADDSCTQGQALIVRAPTMPMEPPAQGASVTPPPPIIAPRGGRLVPFDDDLPDAHRTTLPPLEQLSKAPTGGRLLGLLGSPAPGSREPSIVCECGQAMRTIVRLLGVELTEEGVCLGPTLVQACLRCDTGRVHRMSLPRA